MGVGSRHEWSHLQQQIGGHYGARQTGARNPPVDPDHRGEFIRPAASKSTPGADRAGLQKQIGIRIAPALGRPVEAAERRLDPLETTELGVPRAQIEGRS